MAKIIHGDDDQDQQDPSNEQERSIVIEWLAQDDFGIADNGIDFDISIMKKRAKII